MGFTLSLHIRTAASRIGIKLSRHGGRGLGGQEKDSEGHRIAVVANPASVRGTRWSEPAQEGTV